MPITGKREKKRERERLFFKIGQNCNRLKIYGEKKMERTRDWGGKEGKSITEPY